MEREELHTELRAVIAAAKELPLEDEGILIDSFLDTLQGRVQASVRPRRHRPTIRRRLPVSLLSSLSLFLLVLLPSFAFGNPNVATDGRFWWIWGVVTLLAVFVTLARTLNINLKLQRSHPTGSTPR